MTVSTVSIPNNRLVFVSFNAWSMYNFRLDVIRYFISQQYEVHIIAVDDDYTSLLKDEGCIFHAVKFNNRSMNPISDLKLYSTLRSLYLEIDPALIFHYFIKPNIFGSLAASNVKIPSVAIVTGLGYSFTKKNYLQLIATALYRISLGRSNEVWFLNKEDKRLFINKKIVEAKKCFYLKSEGINTRKFNKLKLHTRSDRFVFIMATRLLKSKGVEIYLEAAKRVKQKFPHTEFHLLGIKQHDHPDAINYDQILRSQNEGLLEFQENVHNVIDALSKADCFVLPGYYHEGVPRSLMEACSLRLPVIASAAKGCTSIVENGKNGLLCLPGDVNDLEDRMIQMLCFNTEKRNKMGEFGRNKMIREFEVSITIEFYAQAVNRHILRIESETLEPVA